MTRRFAVGIRAKLLAASSVFLLIPWLGFKYVSELERFLRDQQLQKLAGTAEAVWNTRAPKGNKPGTTPGDYTVQVKGITAWGYTWDGVTTNTTFEIQ